MLCKLSQQCPAMPNTQGLSQPVHCTGWRLLATNLKHIVQRRAPYPCMPAHIPHCHHRPCQALRALQLLHSNKLQAHAPGRRP